MEIVIGYKLTMLDVIFKNQSLPQRNGNMPLAAA